MTQLCHQQSFAVKPVLCWLEVDMQIALADHRDMVGKTLKRSAQRPATRRLYLGEWIRAMGRKPAEVAKAADINEGYLSQLISGQKKNPSALLLHSIADFIGIPMQYLYRPPPNRTWLAEAADLEPAILERLIGRKQ
jgi:transcriptional regulator with XRE-family HTH domain